jgi:hypothetical protein
MIVKKRVRTLPVVVLLGSIAACTPFLAGPSDQNSSLVVGRIVVDNKFPGGLSGLLPLGVLDKSLEVEIESRDGKQYSKVLTDEQGYFFAPNLPANAYHVLSVIIEGHRSDGSRERYAVRLRRPTFTPTPAKVTYIGTLYLSISDRGESQLKEAQEDSQAKAFFLQRYSGSPWSTREFVSSSTRKPAEMQARPAGTPSIVVTAAGQDGARAEKPEWKIGYEWTYAWKRPDRSGKYVSYVIREEDFEGKPSFVIRNEKNDDYYTKDALAVIARKTGSRLIFKRSGPRVNYLWPLVVGKEWTNSYLRENIQEKSSQTFSYRMRVAKVEQVETPAGSFETFKIEVYIPRDGRLFAEYWYSPQARRAVKEREFLDDGLREAELVSYKLD